MSDYRVAVLVASYNRRPTTLRCLNLFMDAVQLAELKIECDIYLTDAASPDSTGSAVEAQFPNVTVIRADSSTYWARGMALAWDASSRSDQIYDYHLLLNDDVELYPQGINLLLKLAQHCTVVVGALCDSRGESSYGALIRPDPRRPFYFERLDPEEKRDRRIESTNGNVVLIPRDVSDKVGQIDARFEHSMADIDYGLRVTESGFFIEQTSAFVGICDRHDAPPFRGPLLDRLRHAISRKRLPLRPWGRLCRRHGGRLWPLYFVKPYLDTALQRAK